MTLIALLIISLTMSLVATQSQNSEESEVSLDIGEIDEALDHSTIRNQVVKPPSEGELEVFSESQALIVAGEVSQAQDSLFPPTWHWDHGKNRPDTSYPIFSPPKQVIIRRYASFGQAIGPRGSWTDPVFAHYGKFMTGAKLQMDKRRGLEDDTAVNGVTFEYRDKNWKNRQEIVQKGERGRWNRMARCKRGHYVTGFAVRIQPDQGDGDDSGLNGMKIKCSNGRWKTVATGYQGDWTSHIVSGQDLKAVGFRVLYDQYGSYSQGSLQDDTGLNGITLIYDSV